MELSQIRVLSEKIKNNISKVIVGKDDVIELVLASFLCCGHALLEDVPGVGKTMIAKCLAKSVDCSFKRIQFTPDLLPSDLTGINYFNQKENEFTFRAGPVFANIVLADEINRATPRTQSSLLECMEEMQVTIDGETRALSEPFFVIATQNPVETQGTFPLPEAQMDRFFMRLKIGYPDTHAGREIIDKFQNDKPFLTLQSVTNTREIISAQNSVMNIKLSSILKDYIIQIIETTRKHDKILLGVSPRGSLALMKAAQVIALLRGRDFVIPDDIKYAAVPVLSHRIILKGYKALGGISTSEDVISEIVSKIHVPKEEISTPDRQFSHAGQREEN